MKKVFITGSTGVVGSEVARLYIENPDFEVHLLIRAKDSSHLDYRREELFSYWKSDPVKPLSQENFERIKFYRGDITAFNFGLSDAQFEQLTRDLTHIVHSAASVKLDMPTEEARQQIVTPAKFFIQILKENPKIKLEYISTVGVLGRGNKQLLESRIDRNEDFFNTYELSKAEAERLIYKAQDSCGAQVTIYRPSMVVGHSKTGRIIHFQVFYFLQLLLAGKVTYGLVPNLSKFKIDTVPCDVLAEFLYRSSLDSKSAGKIFNICAGPEKSIKISELRHLTQNVLRQKGIRFPRLIFLPIIFFKFISLVRFLPVVNKKWKTRLSLFPQFLDYAIHNQTFSNLEFLNYSKKLGQSEKDPKEYLKIVIDYYFSKIKIESN